MKWWMEHGMARRCSSWGSGLAKGLVAGTSTGHGPKTPQISCFTVELRLLFYLDARPS